MKAYAILDGGGVKGAALAGCLKAAEEQKIQFLGYGGTSAGSIIAFLAAVGYTGEELHKIMTQEIQFKDFLDDSGVLLERLKELPGKLKNPGWKSVLVLWKHKDLIHTLTEKFGLYRAHKLQEFLLQRVIDKFPDFKGRAQITFEDLRLKGCPLLKVVTSDLGSRIPRVYSALGGHEFNGSALDAVRASMSYPFVFRPVKMNEQYLVDGGLCSNLPLFLFEQERNKDGLPVIAFDLESAPASAGDGYGFRNFCGDMMSTALESADHLQQRMIQGIHHVRIPIPEGIDTLDFNLTADQCETLFLAGHSATHSFFSLRVPQWGQVTNQVERLQALHVSPKLVVPVLQAIAKEIESETPARNVRCHIMLPTDHGTRIIVYQFGMDNDADSDLELGMDAGCSGAAWSKRKPIVADLIEAKKDYESVWKMSKTQQNKVRADRQTMFSVPMFDLRTAGDALIVDNLREIGVLSIDTATSLEQTQWLNERKAFVVQKGKEWADILSRILQ